MQPSCRKAAHPLENQSRQPADLERSAGIVTTKRILYFFTRDDEEELSASLAALFPALKFIDGQLWPTPHPPTCAGIHLCRDSYVYLWPSDLHPVLPFLPLPVERQLNGNFYEGPQNGPVLQFERCRFKDGELEMGQLAAQTSDKYPTCGALFMKIAAYLKKRYACKTSAFSSTTGEQLFNNSSGYLIGKSIKADPELAPTLRVFLGRDDYIACQ